MKPFEPNAAATVNIDVSGSSQSKKVTEGRTADIRIMNDGTATAWVDFGTSTVTTAATTGFPVGAGVTEVVRVVSVDNTPIYVAAIAAAATGKIYFTPGSGS